jgi:hypothetical protein
VPCRLVIRRSAGLAESGPADLATSRSDERPNGGPAAQIADQNYRHDRG